MNKHLKKAVFLLACANVPQAQLTRGFARIGPLEGINDAYFKAKLPTSSDQAQLYRITSTLISAGDAGCADSRIEGCRQIREKVPMLIKSMPPSELRRVFDRSEERSIADSNPKEHRPAEVPVCRMTRALSKNIQLPWGDLA